MTTAKTAPAPDTFKSPAQVELDFQNRLRDQHSGSNDVENPGGEEDLDKDTDPYNSTGQHVLLELEKYDGK